MKQTQQERKQMHTKDLNQGYKKCIDGIIELTVSYLVHEYKSRMDMKKVRRAEENAKAYLLGSRYTFLGIAHGTILSKGQRATVLKNIDLEKELDFNKIKKLAKKRLDQ